MLSSSLTEVLYSIVVLLPRAWKRLHLFVTWVLKYISVGCAIMRSGQAVLKICSFDGSHPWMGNRLVPVSVQHNLPQYKIQHNFPPVLLLELNSFPVACVYCQHTEHPSGSIKRQFLLSFCGSRIYPVSFSNSWFLLLGDYSCPAVFFFSPSTSCLEIRKLSMEIWGSCRSLWWAAFPYISVGCVF